MKKAKKKAVKAVVAEVPEVIVPVETIEDKAEAYFQLWKTYTDWVIEVEEDWEPIEFGVQRVFFYNEIQDVGETDSIPGVYKVIVKGKDIVEVSVKVGDLERWVYRE